MILLLLFLLAVEWLSCSIERWEYIDDDVDDRTTTILCYLLPLLLHCICPASVWHRGEEVYWQVELVLPTTSIHLYILPSSPPIPPPPLLAFNVIASPPTISAQKNITFCANFQCQTLIVYSCHLFAVMKLIFSITICRPSWSSTYICEHIHLRHHHHHLILLLLPPLPLRRGRLGRKVIYSYAIYLLHRLLH